MAFRVRGHPNIVPRVSGCYSGFVPFSAARESLQGNDRRTQGNTPDHGPQIRPPAALGDKVSQGKTEP
jgi:hypothetical protein